MNIPFKQTKNFSHGPTQKPVVVLHFTLGSYSGAVSWLTNSARTNRSSAHYVIGRNEGEIVQLVRNTDIAWHSGNISNPTPRALAVMKKDPYGEFINPNQYCVGIELDAGYDVNHNGALEPAEKDVTEWQYVCLMDLLRSLAAEPALGFVLDEKNILVHGDIADYKEKPEIVRETIIKKLFPFSDSTLNSKLSEFTIVELCTEVLNRLHEDYEK